MADTLNTDMAISSPTSALKAIDSKGASTNVRVPLDNLKPLPGFNVRVKNDEYKESVRAFADSIKLNGFYDHKPLAVVVLENDPTVWVYDGETRYDALKLLESEGTTFSDIPVSLAPAGTTIEDLTVAMAQSNDGRQLTPIALAELVKRLLSYNPDKNLVAQRIGKTVRYVDNLLVLAGAPKAVRDAVANDKIAAAEAVKIVRKDKAKSAEIVKEKVAKAEAAGKAKATPKTDRVVPSVPMKAIRFSLGVGEGDKMGDFLKGLAGRLRQEFSIDKDDLLEGDGSIDVVVRVIDYEAIEAQRTKAAEKQKADEAKAAAATAKAEAAKEAAAAKLKAAAAAKKPAKAATPKKAATAAKPKPATAKAPAAAKTPKAAAKAPASAETPPTGTDAAQTPSTGAGAPETGGDDGMGGL